MPTTKKQLKKLNRAKKAKAEELAQQAAAGSQAAKKKPRNRKRSVSRLELRLFSFSD